MSLALKQRSLFFLMWFCRINATLYPHQNISPYQKMGIKDRLKYERVSKESWHNIVFSMCISQNIDVIE